MVIASSLSAHHSEQNTKLKGVNLQMLRVILDVVVLKPVGKPLSHRLKMTARNTIMCESIAAVWCWC